LVRGEDVRALDCRLKKAASEMGLFLLS
jgi:hypothetical protein